jgi:hypothetical protein
VKEQPLRKDKRNEIGRSRYLHIAWAAHVEKYIGICKNEYTRADIFTAGTENLYVHSTGMDKRALFLINCQG